MELEELPKMLLGCGIRSVAKKRYQAVGFPCNRMLKLSSSRRIRIDIPVLSVSWSFDCLLYTSPSPRDQRGSRMPSSA